MEWLQKIISKTGLSPKQAKWIGIGLLVSIVIAAILIIYFTVIKKMIKQNAANMHTSQAEIDYIKQHEGLRLNAYQDTGGLWTIGYGSITMPDGSPVQAGDTITEDQADTMLLNEVAKFESMLVGAVTVPLTQNQYDAIIDFLFGTGNAQSELFIYVNNNDWAGAANWLESHYVTDVQGHYLTALQNIRDTEASELTS
jgi:GH24 family phage-related lysozyme (muramidase)